MLCENWQKKELSIDERNSIYKTNKWIRSWFVYSLTATCDLNFVVSSFYRPVHISNALHLSFDFYCPTHQTKHILSQNFSSPVQLKRRFCAFNWIRILSWLSISFPCIRQMIRENGHNFCVPFPVSVLNSLSPVANRWILFMSATILAFVCGTSLGWSSPVSAALKSADHTSYDFHVSEGEFSWIGSSLTLSKQFSNSFVCCWKIIAKMWNRFVPLRYT